jgi:hypothetical protein
MLSILKRNAKFILTQYNIFSAAYYVAKGDFGHLAMMSTLWFLLFIGSIVAMALLDDSSPKDPEG